MTNAERIQANNAELREAIGIAESLPDAESETMVGTWVFVESPDLYHDEVGRDFDLIFHTAEESYDGMFIDWDYIEYRRGDKYYAVYDAEWLNDVCKTITIDEEPTDPLLIELIKANVRKATYEDGFAEGEKAILSTYIDWAVSTTSSSCSVEFYNDCDFYAHINLNVYEQTQGDSYREQFVLAPHEEYYISEGDMGWQDFSGGEWYVTVTIEGFSKDGEL